MPLQTSGAISLNDIHIEAGGTSGSLATINDSDIRGLTPASGKSISTGSGTTIDFADFYGASSLVPGQRTFTDAEDGETWYVPSGVTSVCILCIGAGGGGGQSINANIGPQGGAGGGLSWRNNVPVTPGERLDIDIGEGGRGEREQSGRYTGETGGRSQVKRGSTILCLAYGGRGGSNDSQGRTAGGNGGTAASSVNDGGGNGGRGGYRASNSAGGAGGGAAGYTGNGGDGGSTNSNTGQTGGSGGGGGGGEADSTGSGGGGGVGIFGQGASGGATGNLNGSSGAGGYGGSGGGNGGVHNGGNAQGSGGLYGGGGGTDEDDSNSEGGRGADGRVRIIWGANRAFPSTNTGNL